MNLSLEDRVLLNELAKWAAENTTDGVFTVDQSDTNGVHDVPNALNVDLYEPLVDFCERHLRYALGKEPSLGPNWGFHEPGYWLTWFFDKSGSVSVSSSARVRCDTYDIVE